MKNSLNEKIKAITAKTLVVGIDIGKETHWAKITDHRGVLLRKKAIRVDNNIKGYENLLENIAKMEQKYEAEKIIIGFESSSHYWRALARWLKSVKEAPVIVGVNPYHTYQARAMDDNSPTQNDEKDALTIAHLIRDGRYYEVVFQEGEYAELRILNEERYQLVKKQTRAKNTLIAVLDEYFPELASVWSDVTCKTSREIMVEAAFPGEILKKPKADLIKIIKEASNGTQGKKLAEKLIEASKTSIGVRAGERAAKLKLQRLICELDFYEERLEENMGDIESAMKETEIDEILQSMPGVGPVISAGFTAEIGDTAQFDDWKQVRRLAGLNLVENSSGQHKSKTKISKCGRPHLRHIIYLMGEKCMMHNAEIRGYYRYLRERAKNQLTHNQALIAAGLKVMRILFYMAKNKEKYDPSKALGEVRKHHIESLKSA